MRAKCLEADNREGLKLPVGAPEKWVVDCKYVPSKNQKAFMPDLKCVYKAATLNAGELTLDELEAKWGEKYP